MSDPLDGVNAMFYLSMATIFCSAISLTLRYCYKSKCKQVDFCCLKIIRDVDIEKEEDIILRTPNEKN